MLAYSIHKKNPGILKITRESYPWLFQRGFSPESIEARYYLLEYVGSQYHYTGFLDKTPEGKPLPIEINNKKYYWSLSHTENYVGYSLSDGPTGIDIAEHQSRDDALLDTHSAPEYDILSGRNWQNFYLLWTAKEALIKALEKSLDDMRDMVLIENLSQDSFIVHYRGKNYTIQSLASDGYITSIFLS